MKRYEKGNICTCRPASIYKADNQKLLTNSSHRKETKYIKPETKLVKD